MERKKSSAFLQSMHPLLIPNQKMCDFYGMTVHMVTRYTIRKGTSILATSGENDLIFDVLTYRIVDDRFKVNEIPAGKGLFAQVD